MNFVLIADAFLPMKTSGAVQIRDLVNEIAAQDHKITVLLPDSSLRNPWQLEQPAEKITVLRLKALPTKDISYFRRAIGEHLLSFFMYRNLKKSPLKDTKWDAIIWYSPTTFFGPLVSKIKAQSNCRAYLILRDIFPEWAVDMGLLKKGMIYRYFKGVERNQYEQADVIGVQTPSNLDYFASEHSTLKARIEVLNNWLAEANPETSSVQVSETSLAGRKIFVYTGNIGIAQGMEILIELAAKMQKDENVGFIFVGRGTAVEQIQKQVAELDLDNVLFFDEINPNEIPSLLEQCHVGLIALDPRHRNDNIPGKFLAYMQSGLPVLASINAGNDLENTINEKKVGEVVTSNDLAALYTKANQLLKNIEVDPEFNMRSKELAGDQFSASSAVRQIVKALE